MSAPSRCSKARTLQARRSRLVAHRWQPRAQPALWLGAPLLQLPLLHFAQLQPPSQFHTPADGVSQISSASTVCSKTRLRGICTHQGGSLCDKALSLCRQC